MFHVSEEDYRTAAAIGLTRENVYQRVYQYGWDIERAITEPKKVYRKRNWSKWKKICEANGVTRTSFDLRLRRGMTEEEAATTPKIAPCPPVRKKRVG